MEPYLIHDARQWMAVCKPAGLMVEKDHYKNPNLIQWLESYYSTSRKPNHFIISNVHRLDRPVSGLILFAKRKSALVDLQQQFSNRSIDKFYLALTSNSPSQKKGILSHYHFKDVLQKKAILSDEVKPGYQKVELEYEILEEKEGLFFWKIKLITGKYHQIRAQLSMIQCPIIGDQLYGSDQVYKPNQICLHSWQLRFNDPENNKPIELKAFLPDDFIWKSFNI